MMRYSFLVFSNPSPGQEEAYNDWYGSHHLADLLRIPGIVGARRLRFCDTQFTDSAAAPARYLAIYDMETDDPQGVFASIRARTGTAEMVMSSAIDLDSVSTLMFEAVPSEPA